MKILIRVIFRNPECRRPPMMARARAETGYRRTGNFRKSNFLIHFKPVQLDRCK